ncbi:MAG: (2Fe-2S)-binding protein [Actinobacteria bacterium]|nr:MAG: (2Fe-2S)-binding protein [Actinomycetota bacterium]
MTPVLTRRLPADTTIVVDGEPVEARVGETVASALLATDRWSSIYCGMGVCFACLVALDGRMTVRACLERVRPGMKVTTAARGRDGSD